MSDVLPLLKFTPSAQDPDTLETITVQREPLVASLVEAAFDVDGGPRHNLVVGPRGIGKTHLLSLVAHRIRTDPRSTRVRLAWPVEDPWAVRTYEKFLASVLAAIAAEDGNSELAAQAAALRAGEQGDAEAGEELIRRAAAGRRLFLLIENLDEIFRRVGPRGQARFRAFAEDWPQLVLLATSPQLFAGVQRQASPFYGFFAVSHLDELSLASAAELLRKIAEIRGDAELLAFLRTDTSTRRLTAIEALAGGHPRVWLLLAGCISIAAIDELVPLFLEALDDLTPYYQDRLRELSDQQQELVVLLSETGGAVSNRALAARSGLAQNQVAVILRHLADRGYVRRAEVPPNLDAGDMRMSYWELREPLMRLCLDVKQSRGEPLRVVVEFLRAWYGTNLLDELGRLPSSAKLATTYAAEAFVSMTAPLEADALLRGSPAEIVARAERGLSLLPGNFALQNARATGLLLDHRYREARDVLEDVLSSEVTPLVRTALRLQLASAQRALHEPIDAETLIKEAADVHRDMEDASTAVLLAMAYDVADRSEEAAEMWGRSASMASDDTFIQTGYGTALGRVGRHDEALAAYGKAVELQPEDASHHNNHGVALGRLGRHEDAVEAYTRAVKLDVGNASYQRNRGLALGLLGRHDEALAAFTRAVELEPHQARLQDNIAAALGRLDQQDEALAAHTRAVELEPDNARWWDTLAVALGRRGRHDEELAASTRAVALEPETAGYQNNLGVAHARLANHSKALDAFTKAVELEPENARYHTNRAISLERLNRDEEALVSRTIAADRDPDNAAFHNDRGVTLARLGRYEESLVAHARAIDLDPNDANYHDNLGLALQQLARYEEALVAHAHAVDLDPKDAGHHNNLGVALGRLGRHDDEIAAHTRAAALAPDNPTSHHNLGVALTAHGRHEEAVVAYSRASELAPEKATYYNSQADALREIGRVGAAEAAVRRAIELDEDNAVYRFTLAEIALSAGDAERGMTYLREALARWAQDPKLPPGEPDLLCRVVWRGFRNDTRRRELLEGIVGAYGDANGLDALGRGIVRSIPQILDDAVSQQEADAWVEDWHVSAGSYSSLAIPKKLLEAARAWKEDGNRAHILELPPEQREILIDLLPEIAT